MEGTAGDPKNAEPGEKSGAEYQKTAVSGDKGSEVDQKRGVDESGCDEKQVNAEPLSSESDVKRVPPRPQLPRDRDAGVGRSGSDDNKPDSEPRPASFLRADAPEFIPKARAPPGTPPPPRAPEFNPRVRAPPMTPPPPSPSVDATGGFQTPSPSPALPTVRSIGSRSSSGSSSGPKPRPPQQCTGTLQGFADIAKLGSGMKLEMEKRKEQMLQYLNSNDDYGDRAANLGRELTIDFEDLLQKNRELAVKICKDRGTNTGWLDDACKSFFESKKLPSDQVKFAFSNIPSRLHEAIDYIQSKESTQGRFICSNAAYIQTATEHGREVADLLINRILDEVADRGLSWNGKLRLEDILFGETVDSTVKVYIASCPLYRFSAPLKSRLADMKSIWSMIEGGCKLDENNLPLYFAELKSDLTNARHLSGWFIQYLRFHPALYGSSPRRYFITSIQMVMRRRRLIADKDFRHLLTAHPLSNHDDWRSLAREGPLNQLLNYKFQGAAPENENPNVQGAAPDNQNPNVQGSPPDYKKMGHYVNNTGSLLDYVKNGLSHLAQYIRVIDDDEIELFLAQMFPKLLPDIMKGILPRPCMLDKFADCWEAYRKSK